MSYMTLISLLIFQRLLEMKLGKENLHKHLDERLVPVPEREKKLMLLLHTGFFISCLTEYWIKGAVLVPLLWLIPGLLVLMFCQWVRFKTMGLLGEYWTPYPLSFRHQKVISHGPYRFIRHPNYLIVMIEVLVVPLLGHCYITAGAFSLLNFLFLKHRIQMEEKAMGLLPDYQRAFHMKKKLIPFLYFFLFILNTQAGTITLNSGSYDEAKTAPTWFKFEGESKKLGMIKSHFDGYARKATLKYDEGTGAISNVVLEIDAAAMDTDSSMRNDKMRETTLSTDKYPTITVKIASIKTTEASQEVPAEMTVRGKTVPLKVKINKGEDGSFEGSSSFGLKDSDIPDPSIAIASVNDEFKIKFRVKLNL